MELLSLASALLLDIMVPAQDIFLPDTIYYNTTEPEKTVLYAEGFMGRCGEPTGFDGAACLAVSPGMESVEVNGCKVALDLVPCDPAAAACVSATVLCFGESTTEMRCKDPFKGGAARNWVVMAQEELPSGVRLVGNIGHGGWSSYTYLQWPCAAKLDPNTPKSFFKSETMWYALGLRTATGEEYDGSPRQFDLIIRTPFGFHPMDGHKSLWELVQHLGTRSNFPEFREAGEYTGSKAQIEALRDWADELMDNPINEFYDRKTAQGGDHAFSLKAGLKRKHIKSVTHAVVNIGINDGDAFGSLECISECMEKLLLCLGDIPVAHYVNRWPGVCHPSLWPSYIPRQYDINGNTANLLLMQKKWREIASRHVNIYELDVWHIQSPVSQLEEKVTSDGRLDCSKNDVHTGYEGIKSSAHQVACWLIHVISR